MAKQRRDLHLADPVSDGRLDQAAKPLVVQAFEQVGDQAARAMTDAGLLSLRCLQESADGAGQVDVAHAPRNHRRDQEIVAQEIRQGIAYPILVPRV